MDVKWAQDAADLFQEAYGKGDLLRISAAAGQGLDRLTEVLCDHLDRLDENESDVQD
jgi:GTP-binding protein